MDQEAREEIARLKEHLHRVQKVCELHRKLGEDTEFEIRELRRKIENVKHAVQEFAQMYKNINPDDPALPFCNTALLAVLKALEK